MSLVHSHDKHERYEELKYKKCCHQKGLSRKRGNNEILLCFHIYILDVADTHTEDCDKPVDRWDLKTCYTCKISSSKESHIEQNHLQTHNPKYQKTLYTCYIVQMQQKDQGKKRRWLTKIKGIRTSDSCKYLSSLPIVTCSSLFSSDRDESFALLEWWEAFSNNIHAISTTARAL